MKRRLLATLISSLVLGTSAVHAQDMNVEVENNQNDAASSQQLNIASGTAIVDGQINYDGDVDYYHFYGKQGDVVTFDIDGAASTDFMASLDTSMGVFLSGFDPANGQAFPLLTSNQNADALDSGSVATLLGVYADPYIGAYPLPADGNYVVAIAPGYNASFAPGGQAVSVDPYEPHGNYQLIISGVTPLAQQTATTSTTTTTSTATATAADTGTTTTTTTDSANTVTTTTTSDPTVQYVNIEIKPGSKGFGVLNPKANGRFPVAITSTTTFDATAIDTSTLTFGATGTEAPLTQCTTRDVNHDGLLDLVCFADNRKSGFSASSVEGAATGVTKSGKTIKGHGTLKVIPQRANPKR